MSSSHKIITASKLRGERRALSTSGIETRIVVPTLSFGYFLLVNLNIFDACFSKQITDFCRWSLIFSILLPLKKTTITIL